MWLCIVAMVVFGVYFIERNLDTYHRNVPYFDIYRNNILVHFDTTEISKSCGNISLRQPPVTIGDEFGDN